MDRCMEQEPKLVNIKFLLYKVPQPHFKMRNYSVIAVRLEVQIKGVESSTFPLNSLE